jgi:hypothetical protein
VTWDGKCDANPTAKSAADDVRQAGVRLLFLAAAR